MSFVAETNAVDMYHGKYDPRVQMQEIVRLWVTRNKVSFFGYEEIHRQWTRAHATAARCMTTGDVRIIARRMGLCISSCPTLMTMYRICRRNHSSGAHPDNCACREEWWGSEFED